MTWLEIEHTEMYDNFKKWRLLYRDEAIKPLWIKTTKRLSLRTQTADETKGFSLKAGQCAVFPKCSVQKYLY